jgi:hypothetical protein
MSLPRLNSSYFIDLLMKAAIGIAVTVGSYFARDVYMRVDKLKEENVIQERDIAVHDEAITTLKKMLEKIDHKLDVIIERRQ